MPRRIDKKYQKELLRFCLLACFLVSPSFAQSQGTPTGQQTRQVPSSTTNSTPSSIPVDVGGTLDESSSQVSEARAPFTYGAEIDFNSRYVWRGLLLNGGPVAQPSAWISAFGFTFIGWGNVALTSRSGGAGLNMGGAGLNMSGSGMNMGGLILTYDRDWRKLRMEVALDGYTGQQSPGIVARRGQQSSGIGAGTGQQSSGIVAGTEARSTMEGAVKLSYPAGPLRIFTTHAFDVLAYRGSYFGEAGVEYERQVKKNFEFMTSIHSGWASAKFNNVNIGVNKSAFNFVGAEGSLTYYRGQHLYFKPHIQFSSITDRTLRVQLSPANIVNFGLAVGLSK